ncbi:MAG: hypothetical protein WKH64_15900, partial [Chloroflexia bacterium]
SALVRLTLAIRGLPMKDVFVDCEHTGACASSNVLKTNGCRAMQHTAKAWRASTRTRTPDYGIVKICTGARLNFINAITEKGRRC